MIFKHPITPTLKMSTRDSSKACRTLLLITGTRHLSKPSDKEWTKEETDYLFNLVRDFDSRWYIIHDRYEYPGGAPRSLEVG